MVERVLPLAIAKRWGWVSDRVGGWLGEGGGGLLEAAVGDLRGEGRGRGLEEKHIGVGRSLVDTPGMD